MRIDLPQNINYVLNRLTSNGYEAFVVGGCVRDSIMGRIPGDYDVTTSALPQQVIECFSDERIIPTGLKHGTVTVLIGDDPIEITTYRADGTYSDHRRPDSVTFSTRLKDDLSRRDFTINAMAYNPNTGLVDEFCGQEDIKAGVIRCVGEPEKRFNEDALRMLRAVRFAAVLNFRIEDKTLSALKALKDDISYVARERIYVELCKTICAASPSGAMCACPDLIIKGLNAADLRALTDNWKSAVARLEAIPQDIALRWAALLCDVGAEGLGTVLNELRAQKSITDRAVKAVASQNIALDTDRRVISHIISAIGFNTFIDALAIKKANAAIEGDCGLASLCDEVNKRALDIKQSGACLEIKDLAVNGNDMISIGLRGNAIKAALSELLYQVIEGKTANERTELISYAKSAILHSDPHAIKK